jgi:hypothetical protein
MQADRLDKGFVTRAGRRIFVPWFGAPRVVPTSNDEVRILKLKFRMHFVMAAALICAALIALLIVFLLGAQQGTVATSPQGKSTGVEVVVSFALAISVVFGCGALLEYRHYRTWPRLFNASFAHERFMLAYFQGLPIWARVGALGWSVPGLILCLPALGQMMAQQGAFDDHWFLLKLAVALLGPGLLGFLAFRHIVIALASFFQPPRGLPNNSPNK